MNAVQRRGQASIARPPEGDERHRAGSVAGGRDWQEEPADGGLLEYFRLLRQHGAVLAVVALAGGAIALLWSLPQTPLYRAEAVLEIRGLSESFFGLQEISPALLSAGAPARAEVPSEVRILQSLTLIEAVCEKLRLDQRPEVMYGPGRLAAWRQALGLYPQDPDSLRRRALKVAADNLEVSLSNDSRIVEIRCQSIDPRLAADFANTLIDEYIERSIEARWQATQRIEKWLERQLGAFRTKLRDSEEQLQRYARANGLLLTSRQENVAEEKLRQLQEELSRAGAERVRKESWQLLAVADSLPELPEGAPLREYGVQLTDLRRQLAQSETAYTPAHPNVKRLQAQIRELEAALHREREAAAQRLRNDYQSALHRERILEKDYARQADLVSDLAGKSIRYNILKHEVDTNRQLYDGLLQKVKEASVAAAVSANHVRIVDIARVPESPFRPNHVAHTAMGFLCGLFVAVLGVVVRERTDRTLKRPGDASCYLNATELGVIPALAPASSLTQQKKGNRWLRIRIKTGVHHGPIFRRRRLAPRAAGTLPARVELVTWRQKRSLLAESFRATLTSIMLAGKNGAPPRVLVVTSPSPAEGKTTIASNLAISLSESSGRVLLIDGDLRKPSLHEIFGIANRWGLSNLLRRRRPIEEYPFESIAQETSIPGLYVLPSGPPIPAVSHLLRTARMGELLRRLRSEFDTVLIDTAPMIPISDARVLGPLADAVLLVLRAGRTTRESARAAMQRLGEDGTHLSGIVFNGWDPRIGGYGYYDSHAYGQYQSIGVEVLKSSGRRATKPAAKSLRPVGLLKA